MSKFDTVESWMTKNIVSVSMDDTLDCIRNVFEEHRFHHVLVLSGQRLMGVISDRDLLKSLSPYIGTLSETAHDVATLQKRAHQVMTRKPITISKEATVQAAAEQILEHTITCLPVTDENGDIVGIVTWRDVLKALV